MIQLNATTNTKNGQNGPNCRKWSNNTNNTKNGENYAKMAQPNGKNDPKWGQCCNIVSVQSVSRLSIELLQRTLTNFVGAVVVPQLVERSLPITEVRGSNPVIGKNVYWTFFCQLYWNDENKEKEAGKGPFFKKLCKRKVLLYRWAPVWQPRTQ